MTEVVERRALGGTLFVRQKQQTPPVLMTPGVALSPSPTGGATTHLSEGGLRAQHLPFQLQAHQIDNVERFMKQAEQGYGILIADDPGLGKTVSALTCVKRLVSSQAAWLGEPVQHNNKFSCLVVAPKSVLVQWRTAIDTFPLFRSVDVDFNCMSYDSLRYEFARGYESLGGSCKQFKRKRDADEHLVFSMYDFVIFDEVHRVRNAATACFAACVQIGARFRIGLSGTPIVNTLADLTNVCRVLRTQNRWLGDASFVRLKPEDVEEINSTFLISHKKDILLSLPPSHPQHIPPINELVITYELPKAERDMYRHHVNELFLYTQNESAAILDGRRRNSEHDGGGGGGDDEDGVSFEDGDEDGDRKEVAERKKFYSNVLTRILTVF